MRLLSIDDGFAAKLMLLPDAENTLHLLPVSSLFCLFFPFFSPSAVHRRIQHGADQGWAAKSHRFPVISRIVKTIRDVMSEQHH
jgi:hypothetical protein